MRIAATSDWHGRVPDPEDMPECDLLILAGDYPFPPLGTTRYGGMAEDRIAWMEDWLLRVPAELVVAIAGNHDFLFEEDKRNAHELPWKYLEDN